MPSSQNSESSRLRTRIEIVRAEYEGYTNALAQLRRIREGTQIEEDHMRNRQMIVRWLMANSKAIDVRERDGKTYYVMVDPKAFNEGGRLLAEVQRIKAEGDYEASKKLFETYGVHFDGKLRDEVVARVEKLNMPPTPASSSRASRRSKGRTARSPTSRSRIRWTGPRRCWSIRRRK